MRSRNRYFVLIGMVIILAMARHLTAEESAESKSFNVRHFGATGDGRTLDTAALNKAVDACAAAGGGSVVLPPGKYLSGTVRLKTGVELHLAAGATLVGSPDLKHYEHFTPPATMVESKWVLWHRALILADGARNIRISGKGTIDGNKVFDPHGEEKMRGPHTVLLGNCRDVVIRDISIKDAGNYAILFELTDRVEIRNVKITGGWDGVHFRGSQQQPCRDHRRLPVLHRRRLYCRPLLGRSADQRLHDQFRLQLRAPDRPGPASGDRALPIVRARRASASHVQDEPPQLPGRPEPPARLLGQHARAPG